MTNRKFQNSKDEDLKSEFIDLAQRFCQVLIGSGIPLTPLAGPEVPVFSRQGSQEKQRILHHLKEILLVIDEMSSARELPSETGKFLWRSMSRMKLTPASDIFDRISDSDAVVVYDLHHKQIFRSLGYYASVSASLEEIVSLPWWEIHTYPQELMNQFQALPEALQAGQIPQTISAGVPPYRVTEAVGAHRITTEVTMKWLSPVRENNDYVGLVTVSSTTII